MALETGWPPSSSDDGGHPVSRAITEELPQRLSAEMGGGVELSCEIPSIVLIFHEANLEENIF